MLSRRGWGGAARGEGGGGAGLGFNQILEFCQVSSRKGREKERDRGCV